MFCIIDNWHICKFPTTVPMKCPQRSEIRRVVRYSSACPSNFHMTIEATMKIICIIYGGYFHKNICKLSNYSTVVFSATLTGSSYCTSFDCISVNPKLTGSPPCTVVDCIIHRCTLSEWKVERLPLRGPPGGNPSRK